MIALCAFYQPSVNSMYSVVNRFVLFVSLCLCGKSSVRDHPFTHPTPIHATVGQCLRNPVHKLRLTNPIPPPRPDPRYMAK